MKRSMTACVLLAMTGCSSGQDGAGMIGKTVIVHSANPAEMGGMVLITDPGNDSGIKDESFIAKFVPSFRAVVLEDMPRVEIAPNDWVSPRWKIRVEDGQFSGSVVAVNKKHAKLTPTK